MIKSQFEIPDKSGITYNCTQFLAIPNNSGMRNANLIAENKIEINLTSLLNKFRLKIGETMSLEDYMHELTSLEIKLLLADDDEISRLEEQRNAILAILTQYWQAV